MSFFCADSVTAGYDKKDIIKNLSFSMEKGTITGILGANGSGNQSAAFCPTAAPACWRVPRWKGFRPGRSPNNSATSPSEAVLPSIFPLWMWC